MRQYLEKMLKKTIRLPVERSEFPETKTRNLDEKVIYRNVNKYYYLKIISFNKIQMKK